MELTDKKILIAYFSHAGMNYTRGGIRDLAVGNTAVAAGMLAELCGGDLFEIRAAREYPHAYQDCVAVSREELARKARPELTGELPDAADYDLIFLGYPCWCGTCPMPVFSFLEKLELSGKTVAPFCTHEGSGMGVSERDLRAALPGATLKPGLPLTGSRVKDCGPLLSRWIKEL